MSCFFCLLFGSMSLGQFAPAVKALSKARVMAAPVFEIIERIPEIDILVENNQIWKEESFEAKIYHIPGHTTGHIAFYFFKEKKIFTGDTLFSLGCGRIFEGTHEQMYNSLNKIKELPKDTEIYCGHEYTLQNGNFCSCLMAMISFSVFLISFESLLFFLSESLNASMIA